MCILNISIQSEEVIIETILVMEQVVSGYITVDHTRLLLILVFIVIYLSNRRRRQSRNRRESCINWVFIRFLLVESRNAIFVCLARSDTSVIDFKPAALHSRVSRETKRDLSLSFAFSFPPSLSLNLSLVCSCLLSLSSALIK